MQISKRLEAVASFVEQGSVIADVGCDHGYIPIYLYQKGMIPKAIAMDVNKGPLERAEIHIREYGLGEYITTRLSDGVRALKPNEADAVVIAGMGGAFMEKIIEEGEETLNSVSYLILQPQSELAHFRRFLHQKGYCIEQEKMVLEDGKYYPMMKARKGRESYAREIDYRFGKGLLEEKNQVLYQFLLKEQKSLETVKARLESANTKTAKARQKEIEIDLNYAKEALKEYEV